MSRFTTTAELSGYDVTLEVSYSWTRPFQNRDSGVMEGGAEVEAIRVVAAYWQRTGRTTTGRRWTRQKLARLQRLVGGVWMECQGEAEGHHAGMEEAARETWAELRAENFS
jgi:hypothetical protein